MDDEQIKHETANTAPMAGMLNALLSNPDLLQKIGSAVGAMQNTAQTVSQNTAPQGERETASEQKEPAVQTASTSADALSSILSDPSMLEKLPQIIAVMKPLMGSIPAPAPAAKEAKQSPELCRDNLLCSLKPFLSPERRDAVDAILRIAKLGAVFQQLK